MIGCMPSSEIFDIYLISTMEISKPLTKDLILPIKLPYGLRDGVLVHISEVESGSSHKCVCPNCKTPLIAKKGKINLQHFAHKNQTTVCNGESALHYIGKHLLFQKINKALQTNNPYKFNLDCKLCKTSHTGNLIKKAKSIYLQKHLGICIPDLLLTDSFDKPLIAIEVVVSHFPSTQTLKFYEEQRIALIIIEIENAEDLEKIGNNFISPSMAILFPDGKCQGGNKYNLAQNKFEIKRQNKEWTDLLLRAIKTIIDQLEQAQVNSTIPFQLNFCSLCNETTNAIPNDAKIKHKFTSDRIGCHISIFDKNDKVLTLIVLRAVYYSDNSRTMNKCKEQGISFGEIDVNKETIASIEDGSKLLNILNRLYSHHCKVPETQKKIVLENSTLKPVYIPKAIEYIPVETKYLLSDPSEYCCMECRRNREDILITVHHFDCKACGKIQRFVTASFYEVIDKIFNSINNREILTSISISKIIKHEYHLIRFKLQKQKTCLWCGEHLDYELELKLENSIHSKKYKFCRCSNYQHEVIEI